jgi:hypothetical protein
MPKTGSIRDQRRRVRAMIEAEAERDRRAEDSRLTPPFCAAQYPIEADAGTAAARVIGYLTCTLPPGHEGPTHSAHDAGGAILSSWAVDPSEVPGARAADDAIKRDTELGRLLGDAGECRCDEPIRAGGGIDDEPWVPHFCANCGGAL